jgi:hypothetical protein
MTGDLLNSEFSKWICNKIELLDGRAKYCAQNALLFAKWAADSKSSAPPVASFCAIHAVEEAVASFISSAKVSGHAKRAKQINLHNHLYKALVSIFASRASIAAHQGKMGIAVHQDGESLAFRVPTETSFFYNRLPLRQLQLVVCGAAFGRRSKAR